MAEDIHSTAGGRHSTHYTFDDALEALDDSAVVLTLIEDLLCCARDGGVSLSEEGARGLCHLMRHTSKVSRTAYQAAYANLGENEKERHNTEDAQRQGYALGYAAASREQGPQPAPADTFLAGVARGARVAYGAGWKDAGGDLSNVRKDWREQIVAAITEGYAEDPNVKKDAVAAETPTPILTEDVSSTVPSDGKRRRA